MKHLSRFDIEAIADKYVQAYMALPDVRNTQIYRIDPELLLEKVLGLNVEYQHLSYDGSILGMTSFTEMGVQVFEDDDNEAFFFLDGKTVLVEKDLNFDSKLKGRKNFTLMHEGSHQIFKMLFPNDYGVTQKSAGVHYYKANSERNKPISDWEEWQANTLGAAILLPENLIKQGMYLFSLGEKIECLNKIYYPSVYKRFDALADFFYFFRISLYFCNSSFHPARIAASSLPARIALRTVSVPINRSNQRARSKKPFPSPDFQ